METKIEEASEVDSEEGEEECENRGCEYPRPIELRWAITTLKNNKAPGEDGIVSKMIKAGDAKLEREISELAKKIWKSQQIQQGWNRRIICPIYKKGDKLDCGNYRRITLLNVVYKIFSKILVKRLAVYMENIVGDYQCCFNNRSNLHNKVNSGEMLRV
ncbi:uncharacterized protein LOC111629292 [Centruroides sculpturatus]|uniref:uncharacterized protein LOC111629292 n=1 Tax=Centruroides sculpturatus TaxID=218467 RepID=UPI000C6E141F|nr:uncharacterized protein LOC111629292 [Centruroides sculpturatus]